MAKSSVVLMVVKKNANSVAMMAAWKMNRSSSTWLSWRLCGLRWWRTEGSIVGWEVGYDDGSIVGRSDGWELGCDFGWQDGYIDGWLLGWHVGCIDGCELGCDDDCEDSSLLLGCYNVWLLGCVESCVFACNEDGCIEVEKLVVMMFVLLVDLMVVTSADRRLGR